MVFCNDVDLLYWEPDLLKEAALASQMLDTGSGDVDGTAFVASTGGSFIDQKIEAGQVIVLSGTISGCFAITAVTDATHLQISVLYDELFPQSGSAPPSVGVGTASGLTYVIRSFWAQRKVVSELLMQAVGIVPGTSEEETAVILNPQALRRVCALGTLQMIYSALAAAATEPAQLNVRADLYERLYLRALLAAQVDLDLNGDGLVDSRRCPGLVRLARE
jgi:hypothetical protein